MLVIKAVVRPSLIHGLGCFATQNIPKGQLVWEFHPEFDRRYTVGEFLRLPRVGQEFLKTYGWQNPHDGAVLFSGDHSKFFNHSDSPNTTMSVEGYRCSALRDISAGEELTSDYGQLWDVPSLSSSLVLNEEIQG